MAFLIAIATTAVAAFVALFWSEAASLIVGFGLILAPAALYAWLVLRKGARR